MRLTSLYSFANHQFTTITTTTIDRKATKENQNNHQVVVARLGGFLKIHGHVRSGRINIQRARHQSRHCASPARLCFRCVWSFRASYSIYFKLNYTHRVPWLQLHTVGPQEPLSVQPSPIYPPLVMFVSFLTFEKLMRYLRL